MAAAANARQVALSSPPATAAAAAAAAARCRRRSLPPLAAAVAVADVRLFALVMAAVATNDSDGGGDDDDAKLQSRATASVSRVQETKHAGATQAPVSLAAAASDCYRRRRLNVRRRSVARSLASSMRRRR